MTKTKPLVPSRPFHPGLAAVLSLFVAASSPAARLEFVEAEYRVSEDRGRFVVEVVLSGCASPISGVVRAEVIAVGGTAEARRDYVLGAGIALGRVPPRSGAPFSVIALSDSVEVRILDDAEPEANEHFDLGLAVDPTSRIDCGAGLVTPSAGRPLRIHIVENDRAPGALRFARSEISAVEGDPSLGSPPRAVLGVQRRSGASGEVSVLCETVAGGTATPDLDFRTTRQVLVWGDGDSSDKECFVELLPDDVVEPGETVRLVLSQATGGSTVAELGSAVLEILDDDGAGVLEFSAPRFTVVEGRVEAVIKVNRLGGRDGVVGVMFSTTDGTAERDADFWITGGALRWPDGDESPKTFTVQVLEDALAEGEETVQLSLSRPSGGAALGEQSRALLVIADKDVGH